MKEVKASTLDNNIVLVSDEQVPEDQEEEQHYVTSIEHHGEEPAGWSVIPFIIIILMIATGPLFYEHFWSRNYPLISIVLGVLVMAYYLFVLHDHHHPVHSMAEYISFIALLTSLFVASGGILIKVDKEGTPLVNMMLLLFGACIANIIGTTGAS
ncbi:MAG: sodium:proton antiporter, partial [Bacteroidetes bacterium]|nr:sodium:proton antiporter [Bacteroidota bacterium]